MKEYNIFNQYTDELIGTVKARNVDEAERKAAAKFTKYYSNEMYALSK